MHRPPQLATFAGSILLLVIILMSTGGCSSTASRASSSGETLKAPDKVTLVSPYPGIQVGTKPPLILLEAASCLQAGWLEQVACSAGTREHESLLVVKARPFDIHASMLLAGFQPGAPGYWQSTAAGYVAVDPTGDSIRISVRFERDGVLVEQSIHEWIRDYHTHQEFPEEPFVFGGSRFEPNQPGMPADSGLPPGEHYVADYSGSIIGLVTFGDEVIGFSRVMADQDDVQPLEWEANPEATPPSGTTVTIVIERFSD